MIIKRIIACALLMTTAVSISNAGLGVFGSYWNQKDGDNVLGGGVSYQPVLLPVEIRGTFYERTSAPGAGSFRTIPIDLGLTFALTRDTPIHASVIGGGSYYFLEPSDGSLDNKFGWYAGGRLEMQVQPGTALFGELMYRGADFSNVQGDFSGIAFNVGLLF